MTHFLEIVGLVAGILVLSKFLDERLQQLARDWREKRKDKK